MRLILNADDFGYSKGINYGILEAFKNGVLTSTTLMMNMPGTKHALEIKKCNPDLPVGLHLNFSLGKPLTDGKTLIDSSGLMIKPDDLPEGYLYNEDEVYKEIEEQFNNFFESIGSNPSHIDSHLFSTDKVPEIRKMAIKMAEKKNIPLRNTNINELEKVTFINHRDFNEEPDLNYIVKNFINIQQNEFVEIMTHPGYVDQYVLDNSSYNIQRAKELEFLLSNEIKDLFYEKKVKLVSYKDVKNI